MIFTALFTDSIKPLFINTSQLEEELKGYIKKNRPTKNGTYLLLVVFVLMPLLIDGVLYFFQPVLLHDFSITCFVIKGVLFGLPLLILYHTIYFIITVLYRKIK